MKSALSFFSILAGTLLIANTSHAAATACNWTTEVFKSKISDSCQKEFESKLTDDQDKVFSRRMFKDWNIPKDTEITNTDGILEVINENDGTFFQMAYISQNPPTAWINDTIVTDTSTDKSIYRRVERMLAKAESQQTAMNPLRNFLMGSEAYAAAKAYLQDMAFVYTVNGVTGTAQEILTNKDTSGAVVDEDTSWVGRLFGSKQQYSCEGKKLQSREITIDGKKVKIEAVSRTEFNITNWIDGKTVKVDMKAHAVREGEKETKFTTTDKNGKKHTHVRYGLPCQGSSSASIGSNCKDAWADWAKQNTDSKGAYDMIVQTRGDKLNYANDINCHDLYSGAKKPSESESLKIKACRAYFANRFPVSAARFQEDSARMKVCEAGKCSPLSVEDFGKDGNAELKDPTHKVSREMLVASREGYRSALKDAGLDADKICPPAPEGTADATCVAEAFSGCAYTYPDMPACNKISGKEAKKLGAKVAGNLEHKFDEVKDPVRTEAKSVGGHDVHELDRRLLGLMMLGDCCSDSKCSDKLADSKGIKLNGSAVTK